MLEKAKAGIFSQFEVQRGLPIQLLVKISRKSARSGSSMPISAPWCSTASSICCRIFPISARSTSIFCRNVLIYFDQDTKAGIFERLSRVVEPDGFLVLGAAESVVGISDAFKPYPERRGLYRPNGARDAKRRLCRHDAAKGRRRPGRAVDPAWFKGSRAARTAMCCR